MANSPSAVGLCCQILASKLPDVVFLPGNRQYEASLDSYYAAQSSDIYPGCIIAPRTAEDVSEAIRTVTSRDSTHSSSHCQFAIRSGGHTDVPGASNVADGVTIDLSSLSAINLTDEDSIISVGVGSTWGAVYDYLDDLQLSVAGGRAAGVGVGGLTLGGGISYFAPRYGWTCDTARNFQVVLANGSIVNANDNENQNLLWALRGGANNIGVVTRVDLETFPQGELWGGSVITSFAESDKQIEAFSSFMTPETYDEYAYLLTTFAYSGEQALQVVVNNMEYTKPVANASVFANLTSLPALSSTQRITNITDLVTEIDLGSPGGARQLSATLTVEPTIAAINASVAAWNASLPSISTVPGVIWSLGFDPLPPQMYMRHGKDNALGLEDREGRALAILHITVSWSSVADDQTVNSAVRNLVATIQREAEELNALDPFLYINYAAPWQRPIASYGGDNLERLRDVQMSYDPELIFTHRVPGGFKMPAR